MVMNYSRLIVNRMLWQLHLRWLWIVFFLLKWASPPPCVQRICVCNFIFSGLRLRGFWFPSFPSWPLLFCRLFFFRLFVCLSLCVNLSLIEVIAFYQRMQYCVGVGSTEKKFSFILDRFCCCYSPYSIFSAIPFCACAFCNAYIFYFRTNNGRKKKEKNSPRLNCSTMELNKSEMLIDLFNCGLVEIAKLIHIHSLIAYSAMR